MMQDQLTLQERVMKIQEALARFIEQVINKMMNSTMMEKI